MHLLSDTELRIVLVICSTKQVMSVADLQKLTNRGRQVYVAIDSLKQRGIVKQSHVQIIDDVRKYKWTCVWNKHLDEPAVTKKEAVNVSKKSVKSNVNPNQLHPAVVGYVELANRRPKQMIADVIASAVSNEPEEIARWKTIVKTWILSGWNPNNIDGMLDLYNKRQMPSDNRRKRIITLNPPEKTEADMNAMLNEYLKENGNFHEEN